MSTLVPSIRIVNADGSLGEFLPDASEIEYVDDAWATGIVAFKYPMNGGVNASLLMERQECVLCLDGVPIEHGYFVIDQYQGNQIADGPGLTQFTGPSLMQRWDEAIVQPASDEQARSDQQSAAEFEQRIRDLENTQLAQQTRAKALAGDDSGFGQFSPPYATEDLYARQDNSPPPQAPLYKQVTPGTFMVSLYRQAKLRGALTGLTIDFDETLDSNGRPWAEILTHRPEIGTSYGMVLQWLYDNGKAHAAMSGHTLQLVNPATADFLQGTGDIGGARVTDLVLAQGVNIVDMPTEATAINLATALQVYSDAGPHGWVEDKEAIARFGRIEMYYPVQGVKSWDECVRRAEHQLSLLRFPQYQFTVGVANDEENSTPLIYPFRDVFVRDWVQIVAATGVPPLFLQVVTISMKWDANGGLLLALTLNHKLMSRQAQANRRVQSLVGRSPSNIIPRAGAAGDPVRAQDGSAPVQPSLPIAKSRNGVLQVGWDGLDNEGNEPVWDQANVEVHVGDSIDYVPNPSTLKGKLIGGGSLSISDRPYGPSSVVKLVPVDHGGDRGDYSDPVSATVVGIGAGDISPEALAAIIAAARVMPSDTRTGWIAANPVLIAGEMYLESDTQRTKIGTGATWNNTPYATVPILDGTSGPANTYAYWLDTSA